MGAAGHAAGGGATAGEAGGRRGGGRPAARPAPYRQKGSPSPILGKGEILAYLQQVE